MLNHIVIYVLSFFGIWVGSGLAVRSVERFSKIIGVSSFAVSFLILGFLTSISEFSVGINSIIQKEPEIFVGNLVGASIVIFTLIIPLLTITGSKIRINPVFQGFILPAALVVIAMPAFLVMDGKVTQLDGLIAISLFVLFTISIQIRKGVLKKGNHIDRCFKPKAKHEIFKIIFGSVIIFIASKYVVSQTEYFSQMLDISPFLISLLLIAIGTNLPELSIVVRSLFMRRNQVAFGAYVGSAAANTFLFGFLTIINGQIITLNSSYLISLLFAIVGLILFYSFARSKNTITRREGMVILSLYLLFLIVEFIIHKSKL